MVQHDGTSKDDVVEAPSEGEGKTAEIHRDQRASRRVIEAVSEATGKDPVDMQPLYEAIDPDALDQLFHSNTTRSPRATDGYVAFQFEGRTVTVHGDGQVIVSSASANQP